MVWLILLSGTALVFILALFLRNYYIKSTSDTAIVRTGLNGKRVAIDGALFVLPILHQAQKVSMAAHSVLIACNGKQSCIAKDRVRLDVQMEFKFTVKSIREDVAKAAQALGSRIARGGESLQEYLSPKLVGTIQTAVACRSLDEIHGGRDEFVDRVAESVSRKLDEFGLKLVSCSLVQIDQASSGALDENNVFDAVGMKKIAELISENRKERVRIETEADAVVRQSQLEQVQNRLKMERIQREAEIMQAEGITRLSAEEEAISTKKKNEVAKSVEIEALEKERDVKHAKIVNDESLRRHEIAAILNVETAKIDNTIALSAKRIDESVLKAGEEASKKKVILAAEEVQTAKEMVVTKREQQLSMMKTEKETQVSLEKNRGETVIQLNTAKADFDAAELKAAAMKLIMEAEAAGLLEKIKAENSMSDAVIEKYLQERKLDRLPEIMGQMMKPVEKIDSIRINHIGGLGNATDGNSGGGVDNAFASAMEQILGMAVRLPAMQQMGKDIGVDMDPNLAGRTADYANRIKSKPKDDSQK